MGLVKTRRLAAMQKQQRAKAGMKPPAMKCGAKKDDDSFCRETGASPKERIQDEEVVDWCVRFCGIACRGIHRFCRRA